MAIHILTEPEYRKSTWCSLILQGIFFEAHQKKIEFFEQTKAFSANASDLVILIGNSPLWIERTINQMYSEEKRHLILISNTPYHLPVSSIGTDLYQSMHDVISYLQHDCKRKSIAFYGVNENSSTDLLKLQGFHNLDAVYYNHGNLNECFQIFFNDLEHYDSVICANDYAALSLLQHLKRIDSNLANQIFMVSFSNLNIAKKYSPSITSVTLNYYEYGRTAVNLYKMLLKNPQILTGCFNISSQIIPRDTTRNIPYRTGYRTLDISDIMEYEFYEDSEVKEMLTLETLLTMTNKTDERILRMLCQGFSYDQISEKLFMSVNGIKYRLNKLMDVCGVQERSELLKLYLSFFQ